jgi:hypothetical protein
MRKIPTQEERVLNFIRDFGSITRAEAMSELGVANLPAVIDTLRHRKGHDIKTLEIESLNRYGQKITYAKYVFGNNENMEVKNYEN